MTPKANLSQKKQSHNCVTVILALGRQVDQEFKASLSHIVVCVSKKKKKKIYLDLFYDFMYMGVCMYLCTPEEGIRFHGITITDGGEPPCEC